MIDRQKCAALRASGLPTSTIARMLGVSVSTVNLAVRTEAENPAPTMRRPIAGECADCDCAPRHWHYETEPFTSQLVRKPGTCGRGRREPQ